jgi:hypothetical protein
VAAFPFSYYKALRDLLIAERRREAAAIKKAREAQGDDEDIDVDKLIEQKRKQGLAVESL